VKRSRLRPDLQRMCRRHRAACRPGASTPVRRPWADLDPAGRSPFRRRPGPAGERTAQRAPGHRPGPPAGWSFPTVRGLPPGPHVAAARRRSAHRGVWWPGPSCLPFPSSCPALFHVKPRTGPPWVRAALASRACPEHRAPSARDCRTCLCHAPCHPCPLRMGRHRRRVWKRHRATCAARLGGDGTLARCPPMRDPHCRRAASLRPPGGSGHAWSPGNPLRYRYLDRQRRGIPPQAPASRCTPSAVRTAIPHRLPRRRRPLSRRSRRLARGEERTSMALLRPLAPPRSPAPGATAWGSAAARAGRLS